MPRSILDESRIHSAIQERVASHQQAIVKEVQGAVAQHAVVVVGCWTMQVSPTIT